MTQFELGFKEYTGEAGQGQTRERIDFETGEITAVRYFKGPWKDHIDFIHDHLDKRYPDIPQCVIANVEVTGMGVSSSNTDTGQASWERAQLIVTYKTLAQEIPSTPKKEQNADDFSKRRFIEETIEGGVEILQTDGSKWKVATFQDPPFQQQPDAGLILNELDKINTIIPLETITIKQQFLGIPNWIEMHLAKGKVNDNAWITPSGIAVASDSLRYDGVTASTRIDVDTRGSEDSPFPAWELIHKFSHNIFGWNSKFINGEWQIVVDNNFLQTIYLSTDMYSIFFGAGNEFFNRTVLQEIDYLLSIHIGSDDNEVSNRIAGFSNERGGVIKRLLKGVSINDPLIRADIQRIKTRVRRFGFNV